MGGCIVTIARQASQGVDGAEWSQKFEFEPEEGMFEFKEDQTKLEHGYLTLVFRTYTFQGRIFRFPTHFDLSADDAMVWDGFGNEKDGSASQDFVGDAESVAIVEKFEPEPVLASKGNSTRTS